MTSTTRWMAKALLGLVFALTITAPALASEIEVCQKANMQPPCTTMQHGSANLREWGMSNQISSFSIRSGEWLLCTEKDFTGRCEVFSKSQSRLEGTGFQNSVTSLRPLRQGGGGDWGGWNNSAGWQRVGIVAYAEKNYGGRSWVFSDDVYDLKALGLNNEISSLRVLGGRWRVCRLAGFETCRDIEGDMPDLGQQGMNNQISSIQELGPVGWSDGKTRRRAVLFEHADYTGRSTIVHGSTGDLSRRGFNDMVSSVRLIGGGRWQLCRDAGFKGDCRTIDADISNLSGYNLNDELTSLRPMD